MKTQIDYPDQTEKVVLDKAEYDEMCERLEWLYDLKAAGVDNWPGIDYAYELKRERLGSDDLDEIDDEDLDYIAEIDSECESSKVAH